MGASGLGGSALGAGFTANTCSSDAIWWVWVMQSNTRFSSPSVSTWVLDLGFCEYLEMMSAITFGATPKSVATSFKRYFTKLIR